MAGHKVDFFLNISRDLDDGIGELFFSCIIQYLLFSQACNNDLTITGDCTLNGETIEADNFIIATRIILPLSKKKLPSRFGLRHRAAIGITEKTDALCLIVSEETGKISYVKDGEFVLFRNNKHLIETILYDLN